MIRPFVVLALLASFVSSAEAQRVRRCTGEAPDSALMAAGPIYRDCEVDKPARRRGGEPRLSMSTTPNQAPRDDCYEVQLEFVVDTTGKPEQSTVIVRRSDMREMLEAVRQTVPELHYEPAQKDGKRVRQVVIYERKLSVMTRTVVRSSSGVSGGAPSMPAPRCS